MARMSENFYLRQYYLENEQVPTQTTMLKKMQPPLAKVYFDSMKYKVKVLAGLEPRMKGGGSDWYEPPEELLAGRAVMKPVKNHFLKQLGFDAIAKFGEIIAEKNRKEMKEEKERVLADNDINWKQTIEVSVLEAWQEGAKLATQANTAAIQRAFWEFSNLYTSSIKKFEMLLADAAVSDIQKMQEETFQNTKKLYAEKLDKQANSLYDSYTKKLDKEKEKLKAEFMKRAEDAHTAMTNQIHNLNLDKHIAIEKLRQLMESMNLACQVYVALKERDECKKEMELSRQNHKKTVKRLQENIAIKDIEIRLAQEKEKKRGEFTAIWKKKICEVVKKFQLFVGYCLKTLPEQADFFIDMEKLMMLQLNQAQDNPSASSIFVPEPEVHTPISKPHPYYLCCDKGYKAGVDQNLCPKHCTSSASQLPVVIVNKRCIYAACDNFENFTDKVTEFVHGRRDDIDFEDSHNYGNDFQFKMTSSRQLLELKLESSLMQVLQKELPNVNEVPIACCICKIPYCFCSPTDILSAKGSTGQNTPHVNTSIESFPYGSKIVTRSVELMHEREPKWESYMNYVKPLSCKCGKKVKKHLEEHLPAYMRDMSKFEEPELPNYEKCSVDTLRKLVREAQGKRRPPPPVEVEAKTREIGTQYFDQELEALCTCFSIEEVRRYFSAFGKRNQSKLEAFNVTGSSARLTERPSTFAMDCAHTLRGLLEDSQQLEDIFRNPDCNNI